MILPEEPQKKVMELSQSTPLPSLCIKNNLSTKSLDLMEKGNTIITEEAIDHLNTVISSKSKICISVSFIFLI